MRVTSWGFKSPLAHRTRGPAFFALVSLIAPPRVRSAAFTTMSFFAIPGVAIALPLLGAASDSVGIQASVLALVPVAVTSGLILASAARFVRDDIDAVRTESVLHAAAAAAQASAANRPNLDAALQQIP